MQKLSEYVAFDLEFNTVDGVSHIIQLSAVAMLDGRELAQFDSYVYSEVPLQSFINGLTGITQEKIEQAPTLEQVLADFADFVGEKALIGYNAHKSDLPLLLENGLDLSHQYALDVFDQAFDRRSSDLNGIANLKLQTVAEQLGISGKGHDSLEDARMTALIYEKFLEFDENKALLERQETAVSHPFAGLDLSSWLD
ncbi:MULTISPECIES: 3'-5' exonuclease [unclassified Streptococcus]|uniref:3'-5' exonuclease n=1 Tax=unclassified Streptococcus TaxID=2608887 RepID=UPI0011B6EBAC|nr:MULTISPECIES: 3'-5' exonuclease [unclassified Streptococcus]TWS94820.1 3'-5' exonuclease [Streptococcus sp. sy018]TWT11301.1 3'-5' exonuclease [Streptococcus sp. sy004]